MVAYRALLMVMIGLVPVAAAATGGGDWPTTMGDYERTGVARPDARADDGGTWSIRLKSGFASQNEGPSMDNGRIYLTGNGSRALDQRDGSIIWETPLADAGWSTPPAISDGVLVTTGYRPRPDGFDVVVGAIDAETGTLFWQRSFAFAGTLDWYPIQPAIVVGGRAYAPVRDTLVALSLSSGEVLWRVEDPTLVGALSHASGVLVYGDQAGIVRARDTDGVLLWSFETHPWVIAAPLVHDGRIHVVSGGRVVALRFDNGNKLWEATLPALTASHLAPAAGGIVVTSDEEVLLLDARDGHVRWTHTLSDIHAGGASVSEGEIMVGDTTGRIDFLDPVTGRKLATYKAPILVSAVPPSRDGDRIVVAGTSYTTHLQIIHSFRRSDVDDYNPVPFPGVAAVILAVVGTGLLRDGQALKADRADRRENSQSENQFPKVTEGSL